MNASLIRLFCSEYPISPEDVVRVANNLRRILKDEFHVPDHTLGATLIEALSSACDYARAEGVTIDDGVSLVVATLRSEIKKR